MRKNYSKKRKQFGGTTDEDLVRAIRLNDISVVNAILNNRWNEVTVQGQVEALHMAVIKNDVKLVETLISKNPAIANIKSEQSNSTALTYAVIEGRDERIIQILVNNGGKISEMARAYRDDLPVEGDDEEEEKEDDQEGGARYNRGGYKSRKRRSQKSKRRTQKNKRRRSIKGRRRVKR